MAQRADELVVGYNLLGSLDNFGAGMAASELFPEIAEEEERVGANHFEDEEVINSMGFLKCIDGLNPDTLCFLDDLHGVENELIDAIDNPGGLEEEDGGTVVCVSGGNLSSCRKCYVRVFTNYGEARQMRKRNNFVMLRLSNGAAAFL